MLNWGILGTSFISDTMAQAIEKDAGSQIVAIAGRRTEALTEFQERYQIKQTYLDYEAFLADETIEVVYIALPNHLHHDYVVKAAEAGKHILCEKSLSIDMDKTKQALEAVEKHRVFFMEGLMYLTHPLMKKLTELLETEAIGKIRTISGQYCAPISQFVNPGSKGAIYNLGCYPASLLHLVLQTAYGSEIFSTYQHHAFGNISPQDGNICETSLTLQFPQGVLAQLHCAETYGMLAAFTIIGDQGTLRFTTNPWLPTAQDNLIEQISEDGAIQKVAVNAEDDAFLYEVQLVRHCLEHGLAEAPRPAPRRSDSYDIMELLTNWEAAAWHALAN